MSKTREEMKKEIIDEVSEMTDDDRLVAEYNSFFGTDETLSE